MLQDFLSLLFPKTCIICNEPLAKGEAEICLSCNLALPKTGFHLERENELFSRFWGKANIAYCMAYLKFLKGGKVQKLLYKIKYQNKKEAAQLIGRWYGQELKDTGFQADLIVPVPLHPKKLRQRGYNQSYLFGIGLGEILDLPCKDLLERRAYNSSQTNKNRIERWENVDGIYKCKNDALLEGHILLVDDVVTTGATLEACATELLSKGALRLSIAAIAYAE